MVEPLFFHDFRIFKHSFFLTPKRRPKPRKRAHFREPTFHNLASKPPKWTVANKNKCPKDAIPSLVEAKSCFSLRFHMIAKTLVKILGACYCCSLSLALSNIALHVGWVCALQPLQTMLQLPNWFIRELSCPIDCVLLLCLDVVRVAHCTLVCLSLWEVDLAQVPFGLKVLQPIPFCSTLHQLCLRTTGCTLLMRATMCWFWSFLIVVRVFFRPLPDTPALSCQCAALNAWKFGLDAALEDFAIATLSRPAGVRWVSRVGGL